jgi:hypothetical protein
VGRSSYGAIGNKKKIKFKFRATCIWYFNPKAMEIKIQLLQIHIIKLVNDQRSEDNTIYDEVDHNQNWGKECAIIIFLHIGEVVSQSRTKEFFNKFEHDQCYYVNIFHSLINIEK